MLTASQRKWLSRHYVITMLTCKIHSSLCMRNANVSIFILFWDPVRSAINPMRTEAENGKWSNNGQKNKLIHSFSSNSAKVYRISCPVNIGIIKGTQTKITSCWRISGPKWQSYLHRDCRTGSPISFRQQDLHLVPLLLVVLCSTTACSFISTNKFVLDTNYSCTASTAVGSANERQQSPLHRSLFVSSNSDRCGGGGRQTMHPLLAAGLKVASFKGRSGRSKGREAKRCEVTLKGICVCLFWGSTEVWRRISNPASLMKR